MFISSFSVALIVACGVWYWRKYEKRIALLEGIINEQYERHQKELDDFEYNVKRSIEITVERVRDGRCQDAAEELQYIVEHFEVYR